MKWLPFLKRRRLLKPAFEVPEPESFQAFFNHSAETARRTLLQDGYHAPTVFVSSSGQLLAFNVAQFYERDDDGRLELLKEFWARYHGKADWFISIIEAWEAQVPPGAAPGDLRASQQPNREEVLRVTGVSRTGGRIGRRYVMKRATLGQLESLEADEDEPGQSYEVSFEAPLLGKRLDWLAPAFDPTAEDQQP